MKLSRILMLTSLILIAPNVVRAQVAGSTFVAAAELRDVAMGWSAKRQVLGQPVFNDLNERIGDVDDIIIAPTSRFPTRSSTPASSSISPSTTSLSRFRSSSWSTESSCCQGRPETRSKPVRSSSTCTEIRQPGHRASLGGRVFH